MSRRRSAIALAAVALSGCGAKRCGGVDSTTAHGADGGAAAVSGRPALPPDHALPVANLSIARRIGPFDLVGPGARGFGGDFPRRLVMVEGRPVLVGCNDARGLAADGWAGEPIALPVVQRCASIFGVDGARLLTVEASDQLAAIDLRGGKTAFRSWLDPNLQKLPPGTVAGFAELSSPALVGDVVVVERHDAGGHRVDVQAIDAHTFAPRWTFEGGDRVRASATGIFAHRGKELVALEPGSGEVRWSSTRAQDDGAEAVGDAYVALVDPPSSEPLGAKEQPVTVLDATTGAVVAHATLPPDAYAELRFAGGELYALGAHALVRVDPATGQVLWRAPGPYTPPVRGRDALFVRRAKNAATVDDGVLYALDPATGERLDWSYGVGELQHLDVVETDFGEVLAVFTAAPSPDPYVGGTVETFLFQRAAAPAPVHDKTVDLTVTGATHPEHLAMSLDGQSLRFDARGHWHGVLHGRGQHLLLPAADWGADPPGRATIDFDAPGDTVSIALPIEHNHQACAPD